MNPRPVTADSIETALAAVAAVEEWAGREADRDGLPLTHRVADLAFQSRVTLEDIWVDRLGVGSTVRIIDDPVPVTGLRRWAGRTARVVAMLDSGMVVDVQHGGGVVFAGIDDVCAATPR